VLQLLEGFLGSVFTIAFPYAVKYLTDINKRHKKGHAVSRGFFQDRSHT
jgi:hypothetical protein